MAAVTVMTNQTTPTVVTVPYASLPNTTRVLVRVTSASVSAAEDPAILVPDFALDIEQFNSSGWDACSGDPSSIIMFNWPTFVPVQCGVGGNFQFVLRSIVNGGVTVTLDTP
jgi:hypothetical protein